MSSEHIEVTPAQLRQAADNLEEYANNIQTGVESVNTSLDRVGGAEMFSGILASNIMSRYRRTNQTMESWPDHFRSFAATLRQAADRLEIADLVQQDIDDSVPDQGTGE
jgi:WXG100 family type VII secretion target